MRFLSLFAATLLAATAQAQDIRFGVTAGASAAQGDVSTSGRRPDLTAGLLAPMGFGGGHVIQPRLDYALHRHSGTKVDTLKLGVDYLYHVGGNDKQGLYLAGGLGLARTKLQLAQIGASQSKTALAWAGGLGYDFSPNLGLDLRWNSSRPGLDKTFANVVGHRNFKNSAAVLSVTYRP